MLYKIDVLKNSPKFTVWQLCQSVFLNKVAGFQLTSLVKKRLRLKLFSLIFFEFLKKTFSIENI